MHRRSLTVRSELWQPAVDTLPCQEAFVVPPRPRKPLSAAWTLPTLEAKACDCERCHPGQRKRHRPIKESEFRHCPRDYGYNRKIADEDKPQKSSGFFVSTPVLGVIARHRLIRTSACRACANPAYVNRRFSRRRRFLRSGLACPCFLRGCRRLRGRRGSGLGAGLSGRSW